MRARWIGVAMLTALLGMGSAPAQTGSEYDLSWWTIDGGGIIYATDWTFFLGGTIGQPDASGPLFGSEYTVTGGFWFMPACVPTNGDVDGNGCVDDADLLSVLFAFGQPGLNPPDVNCDAIVDDADLLIVLFNFGRGC